MVHHLDLTLHFAPVLQGGDFDAFTDQVMDELVTLPDIDPGITDPDLTASLAELTLTISMSVEADTQRDAQRLAHTHVRAALLAAGCGAGPPADFKLVWTAPVAPA